MQADPQQALQAFIREVVRRFAEQPKVRKMCGANDIGKSAEVGALEFAIHDFSPLCCYLGDDVVTDIHRSQGRVP